MKINNTYLLLVIIFLIFSCRKKDQYINEILPTFINKNFTYDYSDSLRMIPNAMKLGFRRENGGYSPITVYQPYISELKNDISYSYARFYPELFTVTIGGIHHIGKEPGIFSHNNYIILYLPFEINDDKLSYYVHSTNGNLVYTHTIVTRDSTMHLPFGSTKVNGIVIERHFHKDKMLLYYNSEYGIVKAILKYNNNNTDKSPTFTLNKVE